MKAWLVLVTLLSLTGIGSAIYPRRPSPRFVTPAPEPSVSAAPLARTDGENWEWQWGAAAEEKTPQVAVCPFLYGKAWAYSVEIDDGPVSTLTVSQPLLAQFAFTDAPPGVAGRRRLPFVGGAAVIVQRTGTGNATFLDWAQLKTLREKGWGIINHGYAHVGNSWEPAAALSLPQIRRELFWSQAVLASEMGEGRAATHFVYPNGYTAYAPALKEFGLYSGSRVGGATPGDMASSPGGEFADLNRNYLDEGVWAKSGDALMGVPADPRPGTLLIDFTHGMDADPASPNRQRWQKRLEHIAGRYGQSGNDSVWCAPTPDVIAYVRAARAATIQVERGRLRVTLPPTLPGSRLTVHLTGIPAKTVLADPPSGTLYRRGDEVWVTTPLLGTSGSPPPIPRVRRLYRGPVMALYQLPRPTKVAAVRLLQQGEVAPGFTLRITLTAPDGTTAPLVETNPPANWGAWLLYPTVPERPAPLTASVEVAPSSAFKEMEVWVVAE